MLHAVGCALGGSDAYCSAPPAYWRERVLAVARPDAEVYLVSCANIAVFSVIDDLEAALDRPVVTSNQAVLWDCVGALGCRDAGGAGRLFATNALAEPALNP